MYTDGVIVTVPTSLYFVACDWSSQQAASLRCQELFVAAAGTIFNSYAGITGGDYHNSGCMHAPCVPLTPFSNIQRKEILPLAAHQSPRVKILTECWVLGVIPRVPKTGKC